MKNRDSKDYIYYVFLILYLIFYIVYILYKYIFYDIFRIPECITYKTFGVYCPGCGGTRAFFAFYRGDFLKSLCYNPVVVYFFAITAVYIILHTLARILKNEKLKIPFYNVFIYILLFILIINCVIKNILLIKYNINM